MAALSEEQREALINSAFEGKEFSYSPYSKFRVGAALLASDGTIIKGANIENASYGGTICAERTAIVKSASEGKRSFAALAVVTDVKSAISPCGLCRQVIREFCAQDMPILLVPADYPQFNKDSGDAEKGVKQTSIGELLPDSFGPEHLELPRGTV
ncbi:cytidine deaminase [Lentinula edodes]|uniref:Cytidine deaminase n=1 Tax=Lentinula lateritia TaxID=40482 RepID=A0A9W9A3U1_9AGAR|nr:cytidine deaminase [Lentinula edodes]KAH7881207.1 cytidine deaminase [Lentinula edodes]KAJ4472444.1 cytidine deaminase [Lentinula edodes]